MDLWGNSIGVEGGKAIGEALKVNASLTSLDTRDNAIDGDGAAQLVAAVLGSKSLLSFGKVPMKELRADELTELDLSNKHLGPTEGRVLGGLVAVSASLTSIGEGGLNLKGNDLGDEGWGAIVAGVCANKDGKIATIDASNESIGPAGAKLIGEALTTSVSASLTEVLAFALMHTTPPPRPAGVATSMRH